MSNPSLKDILGKIAEYEKNNPFKGSPSALYEAKNYLISLGGKRARPAALIASNLAFKGDIDAALPAAWAYELFHNFTLAHDDIMDEAPLRRGKPALHKKYDEPTAILAGDNMMLLVYEILFKYKAAEAVSLSKLLTKTGVEICEGQYMDMEFEQSIDIVEAEYIEMIKLKTSVLLAACLKAGALLAGASQANQDKLYELGINLGLGFQIKDDLLDAFSTNPKVGKVQGGDILAGKKTILWTRFMELASVEQKEDLNALYAESKDNNKVNKVLSLFNELDIKGSVSKTMNDYYDKAWEIFKALDSNNKGSLGEFISYITEREH